MSTRLLIEPGLGNGYLGSGLWGMSLGHHLTLLDNPHLRAAVSLGASQGSPGWIPLSTARVGHWDAQKGDAGCREEASREAGSLGHSQPVSRAQQRQERTLKPKDHQQSWPWTDGKGEGRSIYGGSAHWPTLPRSAPRQILLSPVYRWGCWAWRGCLSKVPGVILGLGMTPWPSGQRGHCSW